MTNSAKFTLCVLYTPHFPHSRIQNTLQSMFSTFHTPRFPQFTLHYTARSLPLLPSPSRAVSHPNSLLLLPRVRSRARIPFPFLVERLPRRLQRTPRFPQSTLFVFHTLHYTALSLHPPPPPAPPSSLLPRARSRAQMSFPFHFERLPRRPHRTPCFPHPALLLLQTTIYTASKIDLLEFICRLSYNRWRCLATLKFFSKDSKTAI